MEEVLVVSGLIAVQIIFAIHALFLNQFLALGVNSLSIVIFGGLASALFLLPFAVVFEKKKWPGELRPLVTVQMLLTAITGVAFQVLTLRGLKMTSPAVASAMPNLAPAIIFIIAACVRFERFSIWCKYSRAKVFGTILCLGGAIAMSFMMSPPSSSNSTINQVSSPLNKISSTGSISKDWLFGCFYMFIAVIFLSCTTVLQAATMINFPAPLTLCAVTTLMTSIITAVMQFIVEGNLNFGSSNLSPQSIIGIITLGAVLTGSCVGFQAWCVKKKGPVTVSIFNPVQTVCSAILSALVLGQVISLESLGGMLFMFMGLYVVLWAKKKEGRDPQNADDNETIHDIEKPLLS
ncbi:WAT1-related protein At5g47470-like isoform X2 [Asparagus officinalis]|nr:WAT1-related protein At5g47470-like isoform X2 [Asparagus officinalis]XP_020251059.1 WAT1-related protein At5g47470-like isoform X2 [Asparagus officinalis]XP_020251062.1 WAT1-related protein At5g47470-like isoform X2 [Asparagus officinalis]